MCLGENHLSSNLCQTSPSYLSRVKILYHLCNWALETDTIKNEIDASLKSIKRGVRPIQVAVSANEFLNHGYSRSHHFGHLSFSVTRSTRLEWTETRLLFFTCLPLPSSTFRPPQPLLPLPLVSK